MSVPFLYDTHYQVDKPFALLDLTLTSASATEHASDDALARRLVVKAKARRVSVDGEPKAWKFNPDAMKYWIGNCHDTGLLSRQNAYDYWLMNFYWASAFGNERECWGQLCVENEALARLLLLRWAWLHDGPMLISLCWKMHDIRSCDPGDLVAGRHVEEVLAALFGAIREAVADPRLRTEYRQKQEEISRGFRYNTKRHKLLTHVGLLLDSGLLLRRGQSYELASGVSRVVASFSSLPLIAAESLRSGPLGRGSGLFQNLLREAYGLESSTPSDLREPDWLAVLPQIRGYWQQVERWDRKFLGIRALSELFLVKNALAKAPVWSPSSWQEFLTQRARQVPEELTVHVDRFGHVEYVRLATPS